MKKLKHLCFITIFAALMTVLSINCLAANNSASITLDGITYKYNGSKLTVYSADTSLSGEIVIPAEIDGCPVVRIGLYAFKGCNKITKVIIPEGVVSMEANAFADCEKLAEVSIPSTITKIDGGLFYNCDSLKSFDFSDYITIIDGAVFKNCDNLESVSIGKNVSVIAGSAFEKCVKLKKITVDKENENFTVDKYGVLYTMDKTTLIKCPPATSMQSYTIPDSVNEISEFAFADCRALNKFILPNSVFTIGYNTFKDCGYYNNRDNWVNNILYIGNYLITSEATGKCTVKKGTVNIAEYAFRLTKATEIILPSSVRRIGMFAFADSTALEKITLNEGLEHIANQAFRDNTALKSIVIPDSVTEMGFSAFSGCTALTSVHIGKGITELKDAVFASCTSLKPIIIPGNVETIGELAFYNCDEATEIIIEEGVKKIYDEAFRDCDKLTSLYIPDSVTQIGKNIIDSCSNIKNIRLGKNIQSIDPYAFLSSPIGTDFYFAGTKEEWQSLKVGFFYGHIHYEHPIMGHSYTNYIYDGNASYCYPGTMTAKCDYETCGLTDTKQDDKNRFALDTVTGLKATEVTDTTVTLKWNKVAHASGYRVYRQTSDGEWKAIKQFKDTEYTVSKMSTGTEYKFAVKAYAYGSAHAYGNSFDCFRYANEYAEINIKTAPTASTSKVKNSGPGYITLSWSRAKGATGYRIYRSTSSGWKALKTTTATSYTVSGLTKGKSYTFAVRPYAKYNGSYYWSSSYSVVKTTVPYLEMPALRVASTAKGRATLAWNDIDGEKGYQIWYSTDKDGKYTKITNCKAGTEKYYKTALTSGKTYYFKVRAYTKADSGYLYSHYSTVKTLTIK